MPMRAIAITLSLATLALGQSTFTGPAASATAPSANQCPAGKATSNLTVSGLSGTISKLTVKLNNISVAATSRIGAVNFQLEGPGGQKLVLWRAIGTNGNALLTPITITLDDAALNFLPSSSPSNVLPTTNTSYKPTAYNLRTLVIPPDDAIPNACLTPPVYVSAAPLGTATLGSVFNGLSPNGTWKLHVVHNGGNIVGAVSITGWELSVSTLAAAPTATALTSSANPSNTGSAVTLTARVTNAGAPVGAQGDVTFRNGVTVLAASVPLNASAEASWTTTLSTEGLHALTASYNGTSSFAPSVGSLSQEVNNITFFSNGRYCNTGPLSLPSSTNAITPAAVYPSKIFLNGLTGTITNVKLHLNGFSHQRPLAVNLLLVSPDGRKFVPLSNIGGTSPAGPIDLVLSDSATEFLSASSITAGTFKPTAINLFGVVSFPSPAPAPPYLFAPGYGTSTFTGVFNGANPSTAWQLFATTQAAGSGGQFQQGWCIEPTLSADSPTTTTVNATPNPSLTAAPNQAVTITAHVERQSDSSPALSGTVTFTQGTTVLGTANVNGFGDASITQSFTTEGDLAIVATYSGVSGLYGPSSGTYTQIVMTQTTQPIPGQFCNPSGVRIVQPASIADTASPYPSRIVVPAGYGAIKKFSLVLNTVTHAATNELDMLLAGPAGQNLVFLAGAGGNNAASNVNLTLDGTAVTALPQTTALTSGTFRPASYNPSAAFASPAPPAPYVHAAAGGNGFNLYDGADASGTWRLFITDRAVGNLGTLGSWCVNLEVYPDLTIAKSHTGNFYQGQTGAQYKIRVTNASSAATSGLVTVTETIPSGLTLVSLAGGGWTCPPGGNTCTRSDSLPGNSSYPDITATVNVSTTAPAVVTNAVLVTGGGELLTNNNVSGDPTTIDPTVEVSVGTNPAGRSYSVDGTTYTAPQTFRFIAGTAHTVAAPSPQAGGTGTRYVFSNWSDGGAASHIVYPATFTNLTANFQTQYELTTTSGPGGTISPASGYYPAGGVTVTATPDAGYNFTGFSGALTGTTNNQPLLLQAPASVHAQFAPITVAVTVRTQPAGLTFVVDGNAYNSSQTFQFVQGSQHAIAVASPQAGAAGVRYSFANWSDGGAATHSIPALGDATVTAYFDTEYQLTTNATAGGSIAPASGFYAAGSTLNVTATAQPGFAFTGFSGAITGSLSPQTLVLNAPAAVDARFTATVPVTISTNPAGRSFIVDGAAYNTPQTFNFVPGTQHTVSTSSPQSGPAGVRYVFSGWSNGGPLAQTITISAAVTLTAQFTTEYQLTTTAQPGGAISPASGFYPAGDVTVGATPQPGYVFSGFTGALSGTASPQTLNLQAPAAVTAGFAVPTVAPAVTEHPAPQSVAAGANVTFTAAASGTPAPTVQWQVSSDGGATFQPIPGATSPALVFAAQAGDHGKRFRAVFTNTAGTAATTSALLTVTVSGRAALSALITGKAGGPDDRVWTVTVTNQGPGTAADPRISAFTLTQTAGTPCRPVLLSTLPLAGPTLAPGTAAPFRVSLDFGSCAVTARFTVNATVDANGGADRATLTLSNQLR